MTVFALPQQTAMLTAAWFARVEKDIFFLCDDCGKRVSDGYRDTYGIGV